VDWSPGQIFHTTCAIDITVYPFDTQRCSIDFMPWRISRDKLLLVNVSDHIDLDFLQPNGEWEVVATGVETFDDPLERLVGMSYFLDLRRRRFFHVFKTIVPITMFAFLGSSVFAVPVDSGEKVSLCVTILLGFSVYLTVISDTMPHTSEHVSILGLLVCALLLVNGIYVFIIVVVLRIHFRSPDIPVPSSIKKTVTVLKVCTRQVSKDVRHKPDTSNDTNINNAAVKQSSSSTCDVVSWKDLAMLVDNVFLYFSLILTSTLVCVMVAMFLTL
jgi:nicotinic acetylcholine receptor